MPSWDFPRGPAGVRMLVEAAAARGVPAGACLAGTGLRADDLDDPALRIEAGQELAVARNLVAAVGDEPGLGADAGRRVSLGTFGVLSFALLTSPTLDAALRAGLRFWRLSSGFLRLELEDDGQAVRIAGADEEIPADVRELLIERDVAAIIALLALIGGRENAGVVRVETSLPPARVRALAAVDPGTPVTGGAPRTTFVTRRADLERPLPQADPATRRACELECARLLDARRHRAGTAAEVRARLLADPAAMPRLADIAADLGFDVRTLRRHLVAEGTSYRALRQEVAMTLALELLRTVGLSVGEVAHRVGYADATAFTHAFTRWAGTPPSQARAGP